MWIFVYSPLSGSTYIELLRRLRISMKGLINIKNNDNECFLWCHIRHLNPLKIHPERVIKADKNIVNGLDYEGIDFPVSGNGFGKIEKKNNIWINLFCYENNLVDPIYLWNEKFKNCIDSLYVNITLCLLWKNVTLCLY